MPQAHPFSDRHPIRQLAPQLANQIAAGEVIERPASIVKELLENSVDAGASRINILLEQGGLQGISIQDNGVGIPSDELALALTAHATSKISHSDDLAAIASLGFRGEALASISAVSRLQLTSHFTGSERAWMVLGQHGETTPIPVPAAHPPGTSVTVQELFFNTPARRRFLRSARTEYRHSEEVVRRQALARFEIAFSLQHNRRSVFNLPAATDAAGSNRRLARLCGEAFVTAALQVDFQHSGLRLHGWLGQPRAARPQADLQYFFVNGRIIRDRVINHAVRQAFARRIYPGRYPAYVLYLELDPALVDVNVHPTKHEVRFQQGRLVHDFLVRCVEEALAEQGDATALPYARQTLDWHAPATGPAPAGIDAPTHPGAGRVAESTRPYVPPAEGPAPTPFPVLGITRNQYLLLDHPAGLMVVDLVRWQRDYLVRQFTEQAGELICRPLLIPLLLDVDQTWADCAETHARLFESAGFDLDRTGPGSVMLRQSPLLLEHVSLERVMPALLEQLAQRATCEAGEFITLLAELAVPAAGWQLEQARPALAELAVLTDPLQHPAVRLLESRALQRLFSDS
ncbi:MAG: DNA mismatch repair endonuclease MutL [Proteobacteria bacterium]|jgi:DNA mismatch repair protein MutL|nr:DNA mismatch repair endonuclease MutL [Pseudomonadota bacterium]